MCGISYLTWKLLATSLMSTITWTMTDPWIMPHSPGNKQPSLIVPDIIANKRYEQELKNEDFLSSMEPPLSLNV